MFDSLLNKKKIEPFVCVDIGTNSIKVLQLDLNGEKPRLVAAGTVATPASSVVNNMITNPKLVSDALRKLVTDSDVTATKATIVLPGPCTFSKRISTPFTSIEQLKENFHFEAANYIPHNISDVYMDFQVISSDKNGNAEVLIVAVKNEILNSYLDTVERAGLEPAIVDVDYYALENLLEFTYPALAKRSIAAINLGARYCSVDLIQDGKSIFTGDVGTGGRVLTEALQEAAGMKPQEAEKAVKGDLGGREDLGVVTEALERKTEHLASEIYRQLGFFWSASGVERSIEEIVVAGGCATAKGLTDDLSTKAGIPCTIVDPFLALDWQEKFDRDFLDELGPAMAVSVGGALRQFGDKVHQI